MKPTLDKHRSGPRAVVTGSSSGIGRAIARHLGSSGINVVVIARRQAQPESVGHGLSREFSVDHSIVKADLTEPGVFHHVEQATNE